MRAAFGSASADGSLRLDGVFQRKGHAVQWADDISARQHKVGCSRLHSSACSANLHDGIQSGIYLLDPPQDRPHEFVAEISFLRIAAAIAVADS